MLRFSHLIQNVEEREDQFLRRVETVMGAYKTTHFSVFPMPGPGASGSSGAGLFPAVLLHCWIGVPDEPSISAAKEPEEQNVKIETSHDDCDAEPCRLCARYDALLKHIRTEAIALLADSAGKDSDSYLGALYILEVFKPKSAQEARQDALSDNIDKSIGELANKIRALRETVNSKE